MPHAASSINTSESIHYHFNFHVDSQQLEISWLDTIGQQYLVMLDGWHKGLIWRVTINGHAQENRSKRYIGFGFEHLLSRENAEVQKWWGTIPNDVLKGLQRFDVNRFELAKLCCMFPEAIDLLKANPVLLYMILLQVSRVDLGELFSMKQVKILGCLGFPESKAAIKLLKKIKLEDKLSESQVIKVYSVINDEHKISVLSRCSEINLWILGLALKYEWMFDGQIIYTLNKLEDEFQKSNVSTFIVDIMRMAHYHGLDVINEVKRCKSFAAIERLHDRLAEHDRELRAIEILRQEEEKRARKKQTQQKRKTPKRDLDYFLEHPPHPGNELITPLMSRLAILEEGREMEHCITSYINQVEKGKYYVYRMQQPERLTIGVMCKNGVFDRIEQIKGKRNREPGLEASQIIRAWEYEIKNKASSSYKDWM